MKRRTGSRSRRGGPDRALIERAARTLLDGIGEKELRADQRSTPRRFADAWSTELVSGYASDPSRIFARTIPARDHDMVVLRDIPFTSVCVHHLLPFFGTVHVAYLPDGRLVGLSKIARLVDALARRLQLQERLTRQVAEALTRALRPVGAACRIEAEHLCMTIRGARARGSRVVTTAYTGSFRTKPGLRAEFLRLASNPERQGRRKRLSRVLDSHPR